MADTHEMHGIDGCLSLHTVSKSGLVGDVPPAPHQQIDSGVLGVVPEEAMHTVVVVSAKSVTLLLIHLLSGI